MYIQVVYAWRSYAEAYVSPSSCALLQLQRMPGASQAVAAAVAAAAVARHAKRIVKSICASHVSLLGILRSYLIDC